MGTHEGRIALVTGAGQGIGLAIASALAGAGAAVGIVDRDPESAAAAVASLRARGWRAHAVAADVADYDAVVRACADLERSLGPIDTVVNNAGISPKHAGRRAELAEMDPAEWRRVVDVNLTGAFNCARAAVGGMKARRFGSIVNMSSVAARAYLEMVGCHYSATKAALIGFTRHLAGELGPWNVNVNAVAPGRIDTPLMRGAAPGVNEAALRETPLGRFGTPDDVAQACLFFTSQQGHFVTGQVCDVAGGWKMS